MEMDDSPEKQAQQIYDRILAEILKTLKESSVDETELGDRCGLSQATINRIKKGARGSNLPFKTILKIALGLNIDLTTLYLSASPAQSKLKTLLSEISKMIVND
jgi:transcriptional regulator with XRE-family HTH domain